MLTIKQAQDILIKENPKYVVETASEKKGFFIFSLRHKDQPVGSATGGVCYLVHKTNKQIEPCSIYDTRLYKED